MRAPMWGAFLVAYVLGSCGGTLPAPATPAHQPIEVIMPPIVRGTFTVPAELADDVLDRIRRDTSPDPTLPSWESCRQPVHRR